MATGIRGHPELLTTPYQVCLDPRAPALEQSQASAPGQPGLRLLRWAAAEGFEPVMRGHPSLQLITHTSLRTRTTLLHIAVMPIFKTCLLPYFMDPREAECVSQDCG